MKNTINDWSKSINADITKTAKHDYARQIVELVKTITLYRSYDSTAIIPVHTLPEIKEDVFFKLMALPTNQDKIIASAKTTFDAGCYDDYARQNIVSWHSEYDVNSMNTLIELMKELNNDFSFITTVKKEKKELINKKTVSHQVLNHDGLALDKTTAKVSKIANGKVWVMFESRYRYAGVKMIEGKQYPHSRGTGWKRIHFNKKSNTVMLVEEFNAMTGNTGKINISVFDMLRSYNTK